MPVPAHPASSRSSNREHRLHAGSGMNVANRWRRWNWPKNCSQSNAERGRRKIASGRVAIRNSLALQPLVALAVIATALGDPFHAAIRVVGFVGIVLIDAGVHPGFAGS